MADVLLIIVNIVCGIAAGTASGMGMGGGTLLIPMLVLVSGLSQKSAQGVNMLAFLPGAVIAIVLHKKAGRLSVKECVPIIIAGVIFAILSAILAVNLKGGLLRKLFAGFLFVLAVFIIVSDIVKQRKKTDNAER